MLSLEVCMLDLFHNRTLTCLAEPKPFDGTTLHYQMVDHIPPKAVERIALALMEGTADEKTLNLYKIIIHFKAAVVLYANQRTSPFLKRNSRYTLIHDENY